MRVPRPEPTLAFIAGMLMALLALALLTPRQAEAGNNYAERQTRALEKIARSLGKMEDCK
jgi:hypothetical protein